MPIDELACEREVTSPDVDRSDPEQQAAVELRRRVRLYSGRGLECLIPPAEQVERADSPDREHELPRSLAHPPRVLEPFVAERETFTEPRLVPVLRDDVVVRAKRGIVQVVLECDCQRALD